MSAGLSPEQIKLLNDNIRLATLENPDDPFISVADVVNVERWRMTLQGYRPNVLWVDPWGDVLAGEANNDEDARGTLQILNRLVRQVDHQAAMIILAHSRTGVKNIAQAVGFEGANFGKGSKALYSAARCVWNLVPSDETENPGIVAFHAKNNNGPRSKPFCVRLDPETMLYELDLSFDLDAWQGLVNQRAAGKGGTKPVCMLSDEQALSIVTGSGPVTGNTLQQQLHDLGIPERKIRVLKEKLATFRTRTFPRRVWYGTPEQIDALKQEYQNPKLPVPT